MATEHKQNAHSGEGHLSYKTPANYDWCEVSNGRWERDLDEAEIFYASLRKAFEGTGRMFFAITGHVSIDASNGANNGTADEEVQLNKSLQQAWLALRYSHPTIATKTEFNSQKRRLRKIYHSANHSSDLPPHGEWLSETFRVVSIEQSGLGWCNQDPPAPDQATLFALQSSQDAGPLRRTLVLRSPHDVIDGIGTLQLLGIFLRHLSEIIESRDYYQTLQWNDEHTRLSPPLRVAAKLPESPSPDILTALQDAHNNNTGLATNGPQIMTVPCIKSSAIPQAHQRAALRLNQSVTKAIIQRCKSASVSVTQAYHAAAAIVLASKQPQTTQDQEMQYMSYALINLREQCQPPYDSRAHAASVYHCTSAEKFGIRFTIPALGKPSTNSSEYGRVLSEIRAYYLSNRPSTRPSLLQLAPLLWQEATPPIPDTAWEGPSMPIPPPTTTPSISMSSFGLVERMIPIQAGHIAAYDPWVTGEELGPGMGLFLGTFRGELELSAAYNAAWHDEVEVRGYLERIQEVVEEGLGVRA